MSSDEEGRVISYSRGRSKLGVFYSLFLLVLSSMFALAVLSHDFLSLALYFVLTSLLAVVFFILKRFAWRRRAEARARLHEAVASQRFKVAAIYLGIPVILVVPLVLGLFLNVTSWFISLSSLVVLPGDDISIGSCGNRGTQDAR